MSGCLLPIGGKPSVRGCRTPLCPEAVGELPLALICSCLKQHWLGGGLSCSPTFCARRGSREPWELLGGWDRG